MSEPITEDERKTWRLSCERALSCIPKNGPIVRANAKRVLRLLGEVERLREEKETLRVGFLDLTDLLEAAYQ